MDYLSFYGLNIEPFSNAPVSKLYYNSQQHNDAMTKLLFIVEQMRGLAVVEGEMGTGKTTLARRLLENLPEKNYVATMLVIVHSEITANWLLKRIALQLGVQNPMENKLQLLSQLLRHLMEIYKSGKKAVVLVDEAQMLKTREIMEEFRGLLNLEMPERKLITFVFFGLPEISKHLMLDEPLLNRVALKIRLKPLDQEGTVKYIIHRIKTAGAKKMFLTQEAVKSIFTATNGNPRLINTLCDNAMLEGFLRKQPVLDRALIDKIATDLGLPYSKLSENELSQIIGAASPTVPPPTPASTPISIVKEEARPPQATPIIGTKDAPSSVDRIKTNPNYMLSSGSTVPPIPPFDKAIDEDTKKKHLISEVDKKLGIKVRPPSISSKDTQSYISFISPKLSDAAKKMIEDTEREVREQMMAEKKSQKDRDTQEFGARVPSANIAPPPPLAPIMASPPAPPKQDEKNSSKPISIPGIIIPPPPKPKNDNDI